MKEKLIDRLLRDLSEWPEGIAAITYDFAGNIVRLSYPCGVCGTPGIDYVTEEFYNRAKT